MSGQRDEMELKEEAVKAHYAGAAALLSGFDHAPRMGEQVAAQNEVATVQCLDQHRQMGQGAVTGGKPAAELLHMAQGVEASRFTRAVPRLG